jgi:hypothetical protein
MVYWRLGLAARYVVCLVYATVSCANHWRGKKFCAGVEGRGGAIDPIVVL